MAGFEISFWIGGYTRGHQELLEGIVRKRGYVICNEAASSFWGMSFSVISLYWADCITWFVCLDCHSQAQTTSYLGSCQFVLVNRSITCCNPSGPKCFEGSLPMYRNCNRKPESSLLWQVLRKWQDNTVFNFMQVMLLVGFWW